MLAARLVDELRENVRMTGKIRAARRVSALVGWVAVASAAAVQVAFVVWLFCYDAALRRWWIGGCLVVLLACVAVVGLNRLRAGRMSADAALRAMRSPVDTREAGDAGARSQMLPASVPGAWSRRARGVLGRASVVTAVFGLLVLAGGDVTRPAQIERIHRAGARIEDVEVVRVISQVEHDVRKGDDYYSGVVVVRLDDWRSVGDDDELRKRIVVPKSYRELRVGGLTTVLYSPFDPEAGVVSDAERKNLERADEGYTLGMTGVSVAAWTWVFVLAWSVRSLVKGRRAVTVLDGKTRALRGRCSGWETTEVVRNGVKYYGYPEWRRTPLKVDTDLGVLRFYADASFVTAVGRVLEGEVGWLCWAPDAGKKHWEDARVRSLPAVLVLDDGQALHGRVYEKEAKAAASFAEVPGSEKAPVDPARAVSVWWPRSVWALAAPGGTLVSWALAVVCAGALLTGVTGFARFTVFLAGLILVWVSMCGVAGRTMMRRKATAEATVEAEPRGVPADPLTKGGT